MLVRSSLVEEGEWLRSCSGEDVRSLGVKFKVPRKELRRLLEPLRLIERLNESPRLTKPLDVVLNCRTR